jgi:hypothetical protein
MKAIKARAVVERRGNLIGWVGGTLVLARTRKIARDLASNVCIYGTHVIRVEIREVKGGGRDERPM